MLICQTPASSMLRTMRPLELTMSEVTHITNIATAREPSKNRLRTPYFRLPGGNLVKNYLINCR